MRRYLALICASAVFISSLFVSSILSPKSNKVGSTRTGDELTAEEVKNAVLPKEDVPLGISYEEAVAEGHRVRLYDQEPNDYTVIFQNEDDTRTMYYYNVPVKHTDGDGNTFDIDLSIEKSNDETYKYSNTQNAVELGFPKDLENGIQVCGDINISVKPIYEAAEVKPKTAPVSAPKGALFVNAASNAIRYLSTGEFNTEPTATEEYVDYPNAFGPDTTLRCTPVVNGVKQDVILDKNIGENTFSFDFDFGNREIIEEEDGTLSVFDKETEEITGFITPIKVFDAEGSEAEDCYYTYEKTDGGEWRVTANVNEEFLKSEDTVYPVTVDPDYIDTPAYGVNDATCYKNTPNTNNGTQKTLFIGNRTGYGVCRTLIGFTGLDITAIDESQMYSASFSLKDTYQSSASITIQAYEYLKEWSESTVTWNSAGLGSTSNYGASPLSSKTVSSTIGADLKYPHRYYFNILPLAKKWCTCENYQSYGVMLKSSNESAAVCSAYGSYEADSNKPTLVFRYLPAEQTVANGTYNFINAKTGLYMDYDSSNSYNVSQNTHDASLSQQYTIEYYQDGYYYIHQQNNSERNLKVEYQDGTTSSNVRTAVANPGSDYQLFRIIKTKHGYRLVPKKYLTQAVQINETDTASGTNVFIKAYGKRQFQSWKMQNVVTQLSVTPATASLIVGGTKQASVSITPSSAPKGVTWQSSDTAVATVSSSGLITAKSAGTATITATSSNNRYKSDTCVVTVLDKPDLTVTALANSNNYVCEISTLSATVKNAYSNAAASNLKFSVKLGESEVFSKTVSVGSLAAGATKQVTAQWTPDKIGTYTITATADSGSAISEKNETNNTKTITSAVSYNDINEPTNDTFDGAVSITTIRDNDFVNDYSDKYTALISENRFYKSDDEDYFVISQPNMALLEISISENTQITVYDKDHNVLPCFVNNNDKVKVKCSGTQPYYIKAQSTNGTHDYELNLTAYCEK